MFKRGWVRRTLLACGLVSGLVIGPAVAAPAIMATGNGGGVAAEAAYALPAGTWGAYVSHSDHHHRWVRWGVQLYEVRHYQQWNRYWTGTKWITALSHDYEYWVLVA